MKLAVALQERADLNMRISQLRERMVMNALVQEGEQPGEDPVELTKEFDACMERMETLIICINRTNCATVTDGKTLTEWIAKRDCLKEKINTYNRLLKEAGTAAKRATRTEIKILPTINVRDYQKRIDGLSRELRETDTMIQQTNWTVDLME